MYVRKLIKECKMSNIIKIDNLNKSYGSIKAVNNLSFRVKDGELFSFLGINGAGKSTTINMICGELKKDSGTILVCDKEVLSALVPQTSINSLNYSSKITNNAQL